MPQPGQPNPRGEDWLVRSLAELERRVRELKAAAATQTALTGKAPTTHTHTYADLTDKPATFAPIVGSTAATAKAGNWFPAWTEVTAKPATFPATAHTHMWADLTDKPATFPATAHTHLWADLTDKPATFAPVIGTTATTAKAGDYTPAWTDVTGRPATFAPSSHRHPWADLDSVPATFAPSAHTHPMTDLTGTLAPAQLPAATGSAAGSMSAADKAKLDAATYLATGGALATRHSSGSINVITGTNALDAANKGYVDKLGVFRAAGTVSVPVIAAGATTTVTITFPTSRFTVAPILTMNTGDGHVTVGASTITTASATVTLCNYTAAASIASTGNWQAVQMTASAAAG